MQETDHIDEDYDFRRLMKNGPSTKPSPALGDDIMRSISLHNTAKIKRRRSLKRAVFFFTLAITLGLISGNTALPQNSMTLTPGMLFQLTLLVSFLFIVDRLLTVLKSVKAQKHLKL